VIRVKPESYLTALWITLASWLLVVGVAAIHYHQEKTKNREYDQS
jgi:hypothetical protein